MEPTTATFTLERFDPEQERKWVQAYTIPVRPGMTVLEALWYIMQHVDGTVSFRYSCRGAVCGSCAMRINDMITLACHIQVSDLLPGEIKIGPLPRMKVLKDLVVDMEDFLAKYRSIQPFVVHEGTHEKEVLQSPEARRRIFDGVKCLLCASCHGACPLTEVDTDYLGPAVLTAAQRFAFDDRNDKHEDVVSEVNAEEGALGCRTISRCTEVCPRDIAPSIRIKELKGRISELSVRKRLGRSEKDSDD
jgi:succinate dehydrogenase / fumarate reductase iron-sulfur subunit